MIGISSVSPKGQITIPAEIRKKIGITTKLKVFISFENEAIIVRKLEDIKFEN